MSTWHKEITKSLADSVSAVLSGVTVLLVAVFLVALVSGHLYNI